MKIIKKNDLNNKEKEQTFRLWNEEYPEKLRYNSVANFESYLNNLTDKFHYLLFDNEEQVIGWAITFTRENEKWFAIIIPEKFHNKGIGTQMLNKLKDDESRLNGWVIDNYLYKKSNGNIYQSPLDFYVKNGFKVIKETRLEIEIMSAVKIKWEK